MIDPERAEYFEAEYVLSATLGVVVIGQRDDAPNIRLPIAGPWADWLGYQLVTDPDMPPDEVELRGVDRAGRLYRHRMKMQEAQR